MQTAYQLLRLVTPAQSWAETFDGSLLLFSGTQVKFAFKCPCKPSGDLSIGTTSDPGSGMIYTNSASFLLLTKTSLTGGGTGNVPTVTAGPVTGNLTKWLRYDDNGSTRYIPAW